MLSIDDRVEICKVIETRIETEMKFHNLAFHSEPPPPTVMADYSVSDCCGANYSASGSGSIPYYMCCKCGKACHPAMKQEKSCDYENGYNDGANQVMSDVANDTFMKQKQPKPPEMSCGGCPVTSKIMPFTTYSGYSPCETCNHTPKPPEGVEDRR